MRAYGRGGQLWRTLSRREQKTGNVLLMELEFTGNHWRQIEVLGNVVRWRQSMDSDEWWRSSTERRSLKSSINGASRALRLRTLLRVR